MKLLDSPSATAPSQVYRLYVLAMLIVVYTFNFIDRLIIGILAVPIKGELSLSDTELGAVGGFAFAAFYTLLGIPIGRLADRYNRTRIIAVAFALWSLLSAACGLARSFLQLFLCRLGVGVGEAGGVAPAYSLICDYFPPHQRARALAAYSFGIPVGGSIATLVGGYLAVHFGWRGAFYAVGVAGLVVVPLFYLTVREPRRGALDAPTPAEARGAGFGAVLSLLWHKRAFWALALGAATASMSGYALLFWMPAFLVRSFHVDLLYASRAIGVLLLTGGIVGLWAGGVIADRLGRRSKAAYALVPAVAFAAIVPFYVAGVLSPSLAGCIAAFFLPTALSLVWPGPLTTAIQHLVPPDMRTTTSAIFLFIINLIGIGAGTTLTGVLSDAFRVRFGAEALRYSIVANTGLYLIAAALLLFAARRLERDWER